MKVWFDISSPPHANFLRPLIKEYEAEGEEVTVTARDFGPVTYILESSGIRYRKVGKHGGESLEGKLISSAERIKELAKIAEEENPDVGIGKHSVEGARVAFGLDVPWITVLDHETAEIQNRLMLPLSSVIVSPDMVEVEQVRKFSSAEIRQFHGVCEYGSYFDFNQNSNPLKKLGLRENDEIVVSRAEPYLSSHVYHRSKLYKTLKKLLQKRGPEVIFLPRNRKDKKKFSSLDVTIPEKSFCTFELYKHANLMLGAGCCMNREACMSQVPTVSMYPDELPAPDQFLIERGLMDHTLDVNEALDLSIQFLENNRHRKKKIQNLRRELEDPYKLIKKVINKLGGS